MIFFMRSNKANLISGLFLSNSEYQYSKNLIVVHPFSILRRFSMTLHISTFISVEIFVVIILKRTKVHFILHMYHKTNSDPSLESLFS